MDITFFSKCLKDLVIGNDIVTVPGLGCFIATNMPAAFSDQGRTINPPYRKLIFRAVCKDDGSLFLDALRKSLPAGKNAENELAEFVAEFKQELNVKKNVVLEGLGTMRATAEKDYFFVAADDIDIYPEGLGLEPVSIKTHRVKDETSVMPEQIEESMQEIENEPDSENIELISETEDEHLDADDTGQIQESNDEPDAESTEQTPEPVDESNTETIGGLQESNTEPSVEKAEQPTKPQPEKKTVSLSWWMWVLIAVAVVILIVVLICIFKENATISKMLDNILYTKEELRIINSHR